MSATLHDGYALIRAGYHITANYVPVEGGCSCGKPACAKPGKHPRGGHTNSTTEPATLLAWSKRDPRGMNIGIDLESSGLVDVAPDSPEWKAEFERLGIPEGALRWQSGSGDGHEHWLMRRPDGWPQTKTNRSGEYDIMATGMCVAPPSVSDKGPYTWISERIIPRDELPEAPAWVLPFLPKESPKDEPSAGPSATAGGDADEPPVRLDDDAMRVWRGEMVKRTDAGAVDRSASLYWIACELEEAGATRPTLRQHIEAADVRLGWNCYTARPGEYDRLVAKVLARERKPPPARVKPLGEEKEAESDPCGDQVAALRARIDQLEAHNAALETALATAQDRFRRVLALDRNPHIKAQRTTAKAVAWELQSAAETGRADADGWVKVWRDGLAQNAGTSPKQAGVHIDALARDALIDKKVINEPVTSMNPETGEILVDYSQPPKPRMYLRLRGTLDDYLGALETWEPTPKKQGGARWGGEREPRCPLHPNHGVTTETVTVTVERTICAYAYCQRVLAEEPVTPESQDDSVGDEATTAPESPAGGGSTVRGQDDSLGARCPGGCDRPRSSRADGRCYQCLEDEPPPPAESPPLWAAATGGDA